MLFDCLSSLGQLFHLLYLLGESTSMLHILETCVNLTRKTCIHMEIDSGLNGNGHGNATCHEDEGELGELGKLDVLILLR